MKKKITLSLFYSILSFVCIAQTSTGLRVYEIFQDKCVSCHSNASPQSGLDLEGSGATVEMRAIDVYQNMLGVTPQNAYAAAAGYSHLNKTRLDHSFLFRKINGGLEETIELHPDEKQNMPPAGSPQLTDVEKELIRQWILFGAPTQGEVVSEQLIDDFYNLNGKKSFPDGGPDAPDAAEGFQIKMGPFYLEPAGQDGDELEYFQKYPLKLPEDVEVDRIDIHISGSSHHFIIYNFDNTTFANQVPDGYRLEPDHSGVGLIAAVQEKTDLRLPEGTAFSWNKNLVLDLNSHYINYSLGNTYQAEVYVNVYTKPVGTAKQEMKTSLFAKTNIYIDNDQNLHTDDQVVATSIGGPSDEFFLWGIMGHTHKYGKGYKAWTREGGQEKELIYDAGCAEGIPDCAFNSFDYKHIPMRYFEPLLPVSSSSQSGIKHEASWLNDGPGPVWFGNTSDDEMMVLIMMYTEDTVGLISNTENLQLEPSTQVKVSPNPMWNTTTFQFLPEQGEVDLSIYNILGRELVSVQGISDSEYVFDRESLTKGMYVYQVRFPNGRIKSGKLLIED